MAMLNDDVDLRGEIGHIQKQLIYEFYLRSTTVDMIFSNVDVSKELYKVNKKWSIFTRYLN
jgi:hypothetical protein